MQRAAQLCAAMSPTHYVWIDETGVVTRIGSDAAIPDPFSEAGLWIPPAAGWYTLAWPARALAAEILVYLNLIEGGEVGPEGRASDLTTERSQWREGRRQDVARLGARLPRCLTEAGDRERLLGSFDEEREVAVECAQACPFHLCPYPERSERPFRGEVSETFCREQKRILRARKRSRLPPQRATAGRLSDFWTTMEKRVGRIGI